MAIDGAETSISAQPRGLSGRRNAGDCLIAGTVKNPRGLLSPVLTASFIAKGLVLRLMSLRLGGYIAAEADAGAR